MTSQQSAAPLGGRYKQGVPAIDLFIERGTERVPCDHRYHVVERGAVIASFSTLRAARRQYQERLLAANYTPTPAEPISAEERLRKENLERDLLRSASYWAESYRYGGGGGKLRHR
ncbi:MAG TPA: hypothetical protein VKV26_20855 [Dehalococcoidia bacterium]|nr:hypothetical protein [Dehalococcoidia bacterium]